MKNLILFFFIISLFSCNQVKEEMRKSFVIKPVDNTKNLEHETAWADYSRVYSMRNENTKVRLTNTKEKEILINYKKDIIAGKGYSAIIILKNRPEMANRLSQTTIADPIDISKLESSDDIAIILKSIDEDNLQIKPITNSKINMKERIVKKVFSYKAIQKGTYSMFIITNVNGSEYNPQEVEIDAKTQWSLKGILEYWKEILITLGAIGGAIITLLTILSKLKGGKKPIVHKHKNKAG